VAGASTKRAQVFRFILRAGEHGAIEEEIERGLRMPHQTASARRNELTKRGLIYSTGEKRQTRHNRPATVWRVRFKEPEPAPALTPYEERERKERGQGMVEKRVLGVIRRAGAKGTTDAEVAEALNMKEATVAARRMHLLIGGFIVPTGASRRRPDGSEATVWRARALHGVAS
jgi:predicted transcriptional regulator